MKIKLNPNRHRGGFAGISVGLAVAGAVGGTVAGGVAAGIAATAGLLGIGVTAASLAGAFDPATGKLGPTKAQIDAQVSTDQTALQQTEQELADAEAQAGQMKTVTYVSLGLAVLAVSAGGYLLFRKKQNG